jgi:hypothetical protein
LAFSIVNRDSLLSDLARKLMELSEYKPMSKRTGPEPRLGNLKVSFYSGDELLYEILGAGIALHYLVEDIYYNEEADWSKADRLTVDGY